MVTDLSELRLVPVIVTGWPAAAVAGEKPAIVWADTEVVSSTKPEITTFVKFCRKQEAEVGSTGFGGEPFVKWRLKSANNGILARIASVLCWFGSYCLLFECYKTTWAIALPFGHLAKHAIFTYHYILFAYELSQLLGELI
jgi:hypothetical protein